MSGRPLKKNVAVLSGLFEELAEKGQCSPSAVGLSCECEASSMDVGGNYAWDDVSNSSLDPEMVKAARKEELEEYRKYGVYKKVPIERAWKEIGRGPIGVRWVDINKGDEVHPEYRSRLVAQEIKTDKREDLFAATPPLEAKKLLFMMCTWEGTTQGTRRARRGRADLPL